MFGKRSGSVSPPVAVSRVASVSVVNEAPKPAAAQTAPVQTERRSETYFQTKSLIFGALIEAIDLAALSKLDPESAREEIRDIVHEIVTIKNLVLSIAEQEDLLDDICNDVLGFGPLEPLLARDDIADIMVNGPTRCFIEVGGKIQLTNVRFRDASQLMNICQRIVSQVGRRVDESSPICDARLLDGSRTEMATIIADFDLAFGTAGLDYNQDPPQGVAEAVFAPDRVDAVLVERLLSKCGEKLSLLAAPATLDRVLDFSEASFELAARRDARLDALDCGRCAACVVGLG